MKTYGTSIPGKLGLTSQVIPQRQLPSEPFVIEDLIKDVENAMAFIGHFDNKVLYWCENESSLLREARNAAKAFAEFVENAGGREDIEF